MLSLVCLTLTILVQSIKGTNVAVSSSGIAVGALDSAGLATHVLPNGPTVMQSLPEGLTSISDVSIDENDIVFALYAKTIDLASNPNLNPIGTVCSFTLAADGSLNVVNCLSGFLAAPFTGVSALGGNLIVSGGVVGLTHFVYNTESGMISQTSTKNLVLDVEGLPDVVMVTPTTIAFSADFDLIDFGPLIATISDNVTEDRRFAINGTSGFENKIKPANFPLVIDVTSTAEGTFLYAANGAMAVVDPTQDGTATVITDGVPSGFQAVTVAVSTTDKRAYFGGLVAGTSFVLVYDISSPLSPSLVGMNEVDGRITSIGANNGMVVYMIDGGETINQFMLSSESTAEPTPTPSKMPIVGDVMPKDKPTSTSSQIKVHLSFICVFVIGFGML